MSSTLTLIAELALKYLRHAASSTLWLLPESSLQLRLQLICHWPRNARLWLSERKSTFSEFEGLVIFVENRSIGARSANENRSFIVVGRQLHRFFRWNSITGNQNDSLRQSPKEGQILERHLTGPIFSNTDSTMWAYTLNMALTNTSYPTLVCSSQQKGRKSTTKWNILPTCQSGGNPNHILFSNEALDKAFWILLCKSDRKSAIFGVSIQPNNSIAWLPCFEQTIPESFSCRYDVSKFIVGSYFDFQILE